MDSVRVLLVDDHKIFAEGLRLILGVDARDVEVVGVATSAEEAQRMSNQLRPQVVVMDLDLHGPGSGAEATAAIRADHAETAVVMITGGASEDDLLAAAEAGACGFLRKTAPPNDVVAAIRRAAAGEFFLPATTLASLLRARRERDRADSEKRRVAAALTARERDVIALMAEGLDTKGIAERLRVSHHTARGYAQSVLDKLDAHSRVEAVVRASRLGLIRIPS